MKTYLKLLLVVLLITLTGCMSAPKPETRTIENVVYKPIIVPKEWLEPCKPSEPPSEAEYLGEETSQTNEQIIENYIRKEELLANYAIHLQGDIEICNEQLKAISIFQEKQIQNLQHKNSQHE